MPSKNMLPKGKRRQSVKAEYRKVRTEVEEEKARLAALGHEAEAEEVDEDEGFYVVEELMREELPDPSNPYLRITNPVGTRNEMQRVDEPRYAGLKKLSKAGPEVPVLDDLEPEDGLRTLNADRAAKDMRLDAYLAKALPDISRARVQTLIDGGQVQVDGAVVKPKHKLKGGELIEIEGEPQLPEMRAEPEDIPLDVIYEDDDLAVIDKPAGMTVHPGAGSAEHNRGTLVSAMLFHFGKHLGNAGDAVRPGIVHRLDKETSGLIVVAKNDSTHRRLSEMFAGRELRKVYLALVHGHMKEDSGRIELPIARDLHRRTRMTTRRAGGRSAITNWRVLERVTSAFGKFTLVEVHIETGRTHQIRVHMQAIGHPVVGDTLYGAPHRLPAQNGEAMEPKRNFLHAAELDFAHPRTGKALELRVKLPAELEAMLAALRAGNSDAESAKGPG